MRLFGLALASLSLSLACSSEPDSVGPIERIEQVEQAAQGACFGEQDCAAGSTCDTDQCLSCCDPSAESCISACCGRCVKTSRKRCRAVLCAPGHVPIDPDGDGCDNACRRVH